MKNNKKLFIFLVVLFLAHIFYKVLYKLNHQKMNKFSFGGFFKANGKYIPLRSVFHEPSGDI